MIAKIITIFYYLLCLFFVLITLKNLIEEKNSRDKIILYFLILIPFILRLLRFK